MSKETLNWFQVETETMSAAAKAAYAKLQKANEAQRQAKETFETVFVQDARKAEIIDKDVVLRFGYNFGRLAVAKVDPDKVKPKANTKPKFSF
jgi:hypothetical protein